MCIRDRFWTAFITSVFTAGFNRYSATLYWIAERAYSNSEYPESMITEISGWFSWMYFASPIPSSEGILTSVITISMGEMCIRDRYYPLKIYKAIYDTEVKYVSTWG